MNKLQVLELALCLSQSATNPPSAKRLLMECEAQKRRAIQNTTISNQICEEQTQKSASRTGACERLIAASPPETNELMLVIVSALVVVV